MEIFSTIVMAFFILLLFTSFCHHWRSKSSSLSPASLPFIGHLYLLKPPIHRSLTALSSRHGPVLSLRFGSRPALLVSSATAAMECFSLNDITFANRPHFLAGKHLGYDYTSLVWASYGPHWRNLRLITAKEIFSTSRIDTFSKVREEEIIAMLRALANDSRNNEAVEVRPRLFELALNVMMRMVAGKRFCRNEEGEVKQAKWFLEIVKQSFSVAGAGNLVDFMPLLRWFGYKGFERRVMKLQKMRDAFFQELVEERRAECTENINVEEEGGEETSCKRRKCLIDVLLALQKSDPMQFTDPIIKGVMTVLLLGGTDTSALAVEWALALLLRNPSSLQKAASELHSRTSNVRLIHESDLPHLPYLNAIIKETLRLRPVGPIIPHESAANCTVSGVEVPKGTMLLVNTWAIHRDPELWEDPEAFRPERWEGKLEEKGRKSGKFLAFGMGRRGCPGEALALRVVGLVLGALIQCFEWEVGDGEEVDMREGDGLSMPMATPLRALCKRREFVNDDWFVS